MVVRRLALALFLVLPIAACAPRAPLQVSQAWTRDTIGGTANAAIYMTIRSPTADRLVSASTPAAKKTDLMTMQGAGGTMEMTYLQGIDIPANTPVSLNPTGLHVWLAELNHPLKAGETLPLTLVFEKAGKREVTVKIVEPAAPAPMPPMSM